MTCPERLAARLTTVPVTGPVGKHPSLADLDAGDLKYHTYFRRLYATLLDNWLGCDSRADLILRLRHLVVSATSG